MSGHGRTALLILALGLETALPVPPTFAQRLDHPPPDSRGAFGAPPDDATLPAYPGAAPAEELAIAPTRPQGRRPSGIAGRLTEWVIATGDNGDLPFMIVDKLRADIFAFDAAGDFLGSAPVLVGLAPGDDSAPGIGDLKLSQISGDERTTPAGRFVAGFGDSDGHGTMLWVDLNDAIALHPVMNVSPGEHRFQRIKSSDPKEHRISYGCINVPKAFYDQVVLTMLAGSDAVVYILPDTKPIEDVFPAFAAAVEPPRQRSSGYALSDALDPVTKP